MNTPVRRRVVLAWSLWDWGSAVLERGHHLLRLRPLRGPRRGRRRRAGRAERQHLAGHLQRRRRSADRADRPGDRPAGRRRRPSQAQPGHLDRPGRGHHARPVHGARTSRATCGSPWSCSPPARCSPSSPGSPTTRCCRRSPPRRRSAGSPGFGWSMGYFGGIVLLLICYVGFIAPDVGWFGVTSEGGLNIRTVAVFSAAWFAIFALPVLFAVPEKPPGPARRRVSFFALVPAAARRREEPVRPRPQLGLVPDRLGALPRRPGRGVLLRRHPGGQRLRHGRGHGADLRRRGQRDRRPRCAGARPDRGPGRAEADHHDLPDRPDQHLA